MLDTLIRGGNLIDGTGRPAVTGSVGVRHGRIVAVGEVEEPARRILDAEGLMIAPGFVDPHTHYDAQLFWDPTASVSSLHGVTSVIAGHCGFTLAPILDRDVVYIVEMMAMVEGMSVDALQIGVPWSWHTFGDFLGRLEGRICVNAAFMVGHCAIRRYVMGQAAVGEKATAAQIAEMAALLDQALAAGGVGLSTTFAPTHVDGDRNPVPSRAASLEEVLALCEVVGRHEGTWLEGAFAGSLDRFDDEEAGLITAMSATARRPINWNLLTIDAAEPGRVERHYEVADRARAAGGRVVALTMPVTVPMNMNFRTFCALNHLPGWGPILSLPLEERMATLRRPDVQQMMAERARSPESGTLLSRGLADFDGYTVGEAFSDANADLVGRTVGDIAEERGGDVFATLIDIVCEDDLRTLLWPTPPHDDGTVALQRAAWDDPRVLLGGSDAGAHLDRTLGASYPTRFLADVLRDRHLLPVERAVQLITDEPAQLFGLRGRGRIAPEYAADIVVFDPAEIGADEPHLVDDLPGGGRRLVAASHGIRSVLVNGVETIVDGLPTGATAGAVLRSGKDTTSQTMGMGTA